MFNFVVRYLGFLKHVFLLPHVFDALLKVVQLIRNRHILDYMDDIEREVLQWHNTSLHVHHYGGIQFNLNAKELGHIHGNGLIDILFSRKIKHALIEQYGVQPHHVFKNSGWISFQIQTATDKDLALKLLRYAYTLNTSSENA